VLAQKFFQLIGIKIRQNLVTGGQDRNISLIGELEHFVVSFAVPADIDFGKLVTALGKIFFRVDAPRAHGATVESEFGRHA